RRGAVLGQGQGRQHPGPQGQGEAFPSTPRRPQRRQEGRCNPRRRSVDRHLDRRLRGERTMGLKTYNPTSPGRRQLVTTDRSELWNGKPVKVLTEGLSKKGGRNNRGRTTAFHRGGGHKRTYRIVDFRRVKFDVVGTVERLEYDPNRTAFIALVTYADGEQAYIIAPQRIAAGDKVVSSMNAVDVKPGNAMPLERMPIGTIVHNIEMKPRKGGQVARSAGAYAQYVGRDQGWAVLRLNSGEQRR